MLGSRGARSGWPPARPVVPPPDPPSAPARPAPVRTREPAAARGGAWIGPLVGVAAGWLIAGVVFGAFSLEGSGLLLLGVALVVVVTLRRRLQAARAEPARATATVASAMVGPPPGVSTDARPSADANLDDGLRDIRRMDPKFDPARFIGYIEMVFRDMHAARMTRDVGSLRDRVTPELYGELQAGESRVRELGHASHVDRIEIRAQLTEAWHENGRDYVTAYIAGEMRDYAVDERTGSIVDGSPAIPRGVEAFWTFTRPSGLNPWMLCAIQPS